MVSWRPFFLISGQDDIKRDTGKGVELPQLAQDNG